MLPLIITEDTFTPDGSEELSGPKNHSKYGVDTFGGSGLGVISAEQFSEKLVSTFAEMGPAGEILTSSELIFTGRTEK